MRCVKLGRSITFMRMRPISSLTPLSTTPCPIWRSKKSTADSVTTQTSDLSSLTPKVDKLTSSVAKISQIVGERHARDKDPDYNSDDETLFPDNADADYQSLQSASSSKSSKRRKSVNRTMMPCLLTLALRARVKFDTTRRPVLLLARRASWPESIAR